jgi:hypothetical protein
VVVMVVVVMVMVVPVVVMRGIDNHDLGGGSYRAEQ